MLTPLYHAWADLLTAARVKSLRVEALIIALKTAIKRLENQDRSVSRYVSLWFLSSLSLNPRDFDQNLQRIRGVNKGGGAIAPPVFVRIEGAARQRRRAALLPA